MQPGIGKVVEGALTAVAPVTWAPGSIVVRAPLSNVVVLAARTLERTILPPEHTAICLTLFSVEGWWIWESTCMAENLLVLGNRLCNGRRFSHVHDVVTPIATLVEHGLLSQRFTGASNTTFLCRL